MIQKAKSLWLKQHDKYLSLRKFSSNGYIRSDILSCIKFRFQLDSNLLLFSTCCKNHWAQTLGPKKQILSQKSGRLQSTTDVIIGFDALPFPGAKDRHAVLYTIGAVHWTNDMHKLHPMTMHLIY
eukprot:310128_1